MPKFSRVIWTSVVAGALTASTVGVMKSATPAESGPTSAKQDWSQATADVWNTRFSNLNQINMANVKTLGGAWVSDPFDDSAASRVTPVVKDGMMFVTAGANVYALNAATGKLIWKTSTKIPSAPTTAPGLGPGGVAPGAGIPGPQGVAVGEGKVFVGLTDTQLLALDQQTGKVLWRRSAGEDITAEMRGKLTLSPVYMNGVVYEGVAFDEGRYIGRTMAMDAKDGHIIWSWKSIPGPGEPGHETWTKDPKSEYWKMGGGDIWQPPVIDQDLGLIYYGTGNPSPNRAATHVRPGNNLYSCSVVALDIKTGKLKWYYQLTHHDMWEGDIATPLVLYDTEVGGSPRKGLAAMRADGSLFLLDRATGKPIWPVEERAVRQSALYVTSPTQPFPAGRGSLIERDCSHWKTPPGFILRCEFFQPLSDNPPNVLAYGPSTRSSPMSYSPQTGYFYVQGTDRMDWEWNSSQPATWEFGSTGFMSTRVPDLYKQNIIVYEAVDPKTYKVVWRKEARTPPSNYGVGGWLTTAGGLAFHRVEDGDLVGYDAKTGEELWKFQTGVIASDTASPMSYEVDGQQYVSVIQASQVWAFRLGGTIPQRPAPKLPVQDDIMKGPIQDTQVIRAAVPDEYNYKHEISPLKARIKSGGQITFLNNGSETHTFVAEDGSWSTGSLLPRQTAVLGFDKPGTYLYHCKEHPWAYGLLIVADASGPTNASATTNTNSAAAAPANNADAARGVQVSFAAQAARGKDVYQQQCGACHQSDLTGSDFIPPLVGTGFLSKWQGHSAKDLFDRTRTTMPANAPGSLSQQAYLDLIAYMLQANGTTQASEVSTQTIAGIIMR